VAVRRLFFALWPDAAARAALHAATAGAVQRTAGRPVPIENLHVTLSFLGNVPCDRIAELRRIGATVADSHRGPQPLTIRLDQLEHWARARVLCATTRGEPGPAIALAAALNRAVVADGFTPDLKPFRAHVTVARKVSARLQLPDFATLEWRFEAFALIDSRTDAEGPVYSVVESWSLVKARAT
jgi:RNA 2',3'-cyclic 3'-phosphodiesterase